MSVTVSNCAEISNSPLNSSKSKQLYSFTKSPRFEAPSKGVYCDKFYDLPPIKEKRSTGIGYGHKYDFTQVAKAVPAPDAYNVRVEPTKGAIAWSFGLSREAVQVPEAKPDKHIPGPGAYTVSRSLSNISFSFSNRGGERGKITKSIAGIPGPGAYTPISSISEKGKHFLSGYKDSGAPTFNPPKSKRFHDMIQTRAPGPGAYDLLHGFDPKGNYFDSKHKSSLCRTFSGAERKTLGLQKLTPGPGQYRLPSDFGYYESKDAARIENSDRSREGNSQEKKEAAKSKSPPPKEEK